MLTSSTATARIKPDYREADSSQKQTHTLLRQERTKPFYTGKTRRKEWTERQEFHSNPFLFKDVGSIPIDDRRNEISKPHYWLSTYT